MNNAVTTISFLNLLWVFALISAVVAIYIRWSLNAQTIVHGTFRMLLQLVLVGYVLNFIFDTNQAFVVAGVLCVMLFFSCLIALRPLKDKIKKLYLKALCAITLGGGSTLILVTQGVLGLTPWFQPRVLIPLGGMIFANAMNAVSIAAERFESETKRGGNYTNVRSIALHASLIPITNSLFAVGLVSLPGMMTGQILSGVSPLIAARYQIMVMGMVFGSAGISSAIYLRLLRPESLQVNRTSRASKKES